MTIFEIVESGEVTGAMDDNHNLALKGEIEKLESFARSISLSVGIVNLERAVVTRKERGIGVRYAESEETFVARGVEVEGEQSPGAIVEKLY